MTVADVHDLPLFIAAGLLLNITPGADMALIGSRSALQGFQIGAAAALGVGAGCLVHVAAATFGISALVASSATAFTLLRWTGAAYLVWLGIGMLRSRAAGTVAARTGDPGERWMRVFMQGFFTNVLNPKVALFFLAFLPQFIDPAAPGKVPAFVLLGLVFSVNGTVVNLLFAALVVGARRRWQGAARAGPWITRGVGALFVALGLKLALQHDSRS